MATAASDDWAIYGILEPDRKLRVACSFRDILPVFRDAEAYSILIDELAQRIHAKVPNCAGLVGIESRGFMLACPLALKMNLPFIPLRKPGKLPGETRSASFEKEYGKVIDDSFDSFDSN